MNKVRLIRTFDAAKAIPSVATIGNFDGLHLGHQSIIKAVVAKAQALGLAPTVITFEPLPRRVLRPAEPSYQLMSFSQKLKGLASLGIEQVICLRFTKAFSTIMPLQFIQDYLLKQQVRELYIGEGFRFGYQQTGTIQTLQQASKQNVFEVHAVQHQTLQENKISSTTIRQFIGRGDFSLAKALLGRDFSIKAKVIHGTKRGRTLGFPTANLGVHPASALLKGVFATKVRIEGKYFNAVANGGVRPTVDGTRHVIEVHLLDFNNDLYNQKIKVSFLRKIRDEKRFENIEQLKQQIANDIITAKIFFEQDNKVEID